MTEPLALEIVTRDRHRLAARLFAPRGPCRGAIMIVPAMGVTQAFYKSLAAWLAAEGYLVATFDFRGIGLSRRGSLRHLDTDIIRWAEYDCGAVLDALCERAAGQPVYWIGHSLGGQILPFVPDHGRLAKAVTVAAGSGYWREYTPALRRRAWWLWYVAVPVSMPLVGYFPGKRLRMVGDLPCGVMDQWRRWCLHPEYAVGVEGESVRARYAAVTSPLVSLSFTDDEYMSARSTASLHGFYTGAAQVARRISPSEAGVPSIGHFGFFRGQRAEPLWRRYLLPELQTPLH